MAQGHPEGEGGRRMIKRNDIEIAEHIEEYGILWPDGDETWDLTEEDARAIVDDLCITLLRRHVFVSVPEVAG